MKDAYIGCTKERGSGSFAKHEGDHGETCRISEPLLDSNLLNWLQEGSGRIKWKTKGPLLLHFVFNICRPSLQAPHLSAVASVPYREISLKTVHCAVLHSCCRLLPSADL
jgi:hypothetical protein